MAINMDLKKNKFKKKNRLLKELNLSHNNFGDESAKYLSQYISILNS
jgi:hypothetical protein